MQSYNATLPIYLFREAFLKRVRKNTRVVDKREWGAVDKLFGCPAERLVKSVNQGQGYFFLFN